MASNLKQECRQLAGSRDGLFTPIWRKLRAAKILRDIGVEKPRCCWGGQSLDEAPTLAASPIDPQVFIGHWCARVVLYDLVERECHQFREFSPP